MELLVSGQSRRDMSIDRGLIGGRIACHDKGHGQFARFIIRQAHDSSIRNAVHGHQSRLKFGWCNLEAFVFDQFFQAVGDEHIAIFVNLCDVTGLQPAVICDGLRGGLWVVEIALHDLWPFDPEFAFFARWQVLAGLDVNNPAGCVWRGHACRP